MSQLKLVKLDEPGNDDDAYGLPDVGTSGRMRIPDAFKKKKWEKKGQRKKVKKQLGQKVGYTLHHWRLKQQETHDNLIAGATSYVGSEVAKHAKIYEYNKKISLLSAGNKKAALKFAQKHADMNRMIEVKRLNDVKPHFTFKEFEHEYREHAHKMRAQATVDDQWHPMAQRVAANKFKTPSEKRKHAARKRLMNASGQRPRRGKGGKGGRPSTAGPGGRRRSNGSSSSRSNGSPGTRVIGLDEFLEEGMSSVMPSPMKSMRRSSSGRSVVLLGAIPQDGPGSPSRLPSTM